MSISSATRPSESCGLAGANNDGVRIHLQLRVGRPRQVSLPNRLRERRLQFEDRPSSFLGRSNPRFWYRAVYLPGAPVALVMSFPELHVHGAVCVVTLAPTS
jgi:hypothetical protein